MHNVRIVARPFTFFARLEDHLAPKTCTAFRQMLPLRQKLIHVRWSGEACWIPMGDFTTNFGPENATSYPAPGQLLFYPGGYSETEILLAYGGVRFASKLGQLSGNHFLTITTGNENLPELGRTTLWNGAVDISFSLSMD